VWVGSILRGYYTGLADLEHSAPRIGAMRRIFRTATAVVVLTAAVSANAQASPTWFEQAANITTLTPATNRAGDPTVGAPKNVGGEAAAVFDANHDGVEDIVIANGTSYYFVSLGIRAPGGSVSYAPAMPYPIGVFGDGRRSVAKALGLTDFDRDGQLDLYLGNTGDGSLALKNPRDLAHADDPANLDASGLPQDHRYRSYRSRGDGTFAYQDLGADALGNTRSALFADFNGDGVDDLFAFNAPYFGIWWGGSSSPSQLLPGEPDGRFAADVLPDAVVDAKGRLEPLCFRDAFGRGNVDVKGAVTRDFDGDGRPDVIASAYADVWDNIGNPPLAPADPAGADIDLDHDGMPDGGYQGAWPHGILVLRNISSPGQAIRFRDVSATATDQPVGFGNRMHVYETIPIDFNGDGKLDLVASGVRNFTAFDSLKYQTPLLQLYRNDSRPGHLRFTNVTKQSGLDFMNDNVALSKATGGRYPITMPGAMLDGGPLVVTPLLSAGGGVDINNDGRPDVVLIDRQFTSRNPMTGEEFSLWVFLGKGSGRFTMVPPSTTGLTHTARDITYGDLNGDGRMDLVTVNGSGGGQSVDDDNYVFLNRIDEDNHWIGLRVRAAGNPLGLGARLTVYQAGTEKIIGYDELRTDFAYRSRRDAQLHFGLGSVRRVDVRVDGLGPDPFGRGRPVIVRGLAADRMQTIDVTTASLSSPLGRRSRPAARG